MGKHGQTPNIHGRIVMPEFLGIGLTALKFLLDIALQPTLEADPEWIMGKGQYQLSPMVSEVESCNRAEQRAKLSALQQLGGERITGETLLTCSDNGKVRCPITEFTWSTVNGLIKGIKDKTVEKANGVCTVMLQAYVDTGIGKVDPNFDLTVRLSKKVFEPNENMTIRINATEQMYITVFNWNPYDIADNQVTKLFPNPYDVENSVDTTLTIPTNTSYSLKMLQPNLEKETIEYLQIIATRKPVKFLDTYSLYEFRNKVLDIPKKDRRYIRKPYKIERSL